MATEFNGGMIQDGTVEAAKLAASSVTTAKLADAAVTDTKLTHSKGGDIASTGTIVIDDDHTFYDVTGTTTITGMTVTSGRMFMLQFDDALTLTHGSGIDIPGGTNLTTAAGDRIICFATAADTVYVMTYVKADGTSVVSSITLGTEQATTSGTSIDFTSIPSGTKRITINFVGVSTSGTDDLLIQIGDSGGIENSGYLGAGSLISTAVATVNSTAGYISNNAGAAYVFHGTFTLTLEDSANFTWVAKGILGNSDAARTLTTAGSKSLSAELDRVRITTTGGTDNFDAGAINITYE